MRKKTRYKFKLQSRVSHSSSSLRHHPRGSSCYLPSTCSLRSSTSLPPSQIPLTTDPSTRAGAVLSSTACHTRRHSVKTEFVVIQSICIISSNVRSNSSARSMILSPGASPLHLPQATPHSKINYLVYFTSDEKLSLQIRNCKSSVMGQTQDPHATSTECHFGQYEFDVRGVNVKQQVCRSAQYRERHPSLC